MALFRQEKDFFCPLTWNKNDFQQSIFTDVFFFVSLFPVTPFPFPGERGSFISGPRDAGLRKKYFLHEFAGIARNKILPLPVSFNRCISWFLSFAKGIRSCPGTGSFLFRANRTESGSVAAVRRRDFNRFLAKSLAGSVKAV
ncbi:hypothetical protein [Victivallis sp. Marseille-Q1083]|uniref:hypothetical protein n=1 Tax=Victivallis sp. Marseille-Q1083 TaxID=2717288 RepID=UPI00158EBEB9|nr:hypothetical protein [Victivallis sp. Marseille-Q1083]